MTLQFPESWRGVTSVLTHDWLTGMRGGERCLEILCQGFPQAPIYTLVHEPDRVSDTINRHDIITTPLQAPGIRRFFRAALPLFPAFIERLQPPQADVLISTSHCVAKGINPAEGTRHVCYCFTPMRYGLFYNEYFGKNPLKEVVVRPWLAALRRWDVRASDRVDRFVAISEHVRRRIQYLYQREADLVYPPVDTDHYTPGPSCSEDYDLIVSALVPYKRIQLAVEAYNRMGLPLRIVGTGSDYQKLRRLAGPTIAFTGWQTDTQILEHYRGCRFFIFPGEEDFGIAPVEAQACGKPVIAYGRGGGAEETVIHRETGWFFRRGWVSDLIEAVESAAAQRWDAGRIRENALRFHPQKFVNGLEESIGKELP